MFDTRYSLNAHVIGAVLILAFAAITAHGQFRAGLQGTVTDPSGAAVPGATVTLTSQETGLAKQTKTDSAGTYAIVALAPGHYIATVEKKGFKKKVTSDVDVIGEQIQALNVTLELGATTQTVTVTGRPPLMDTENGALSGTITSNMIQKLPSFGRDVFQLSYLAPGAFGDGAQSAGGGSQGLPSQTQGASGSSDGIFKTENGPAVSANGGQTNANNITLNGIGITSAVWGGSAVITPSEASVKAVKVVTNGYDAENGRYSGAQIQVISKNVTDQFHGSAFFKADRPGLNAYQSYNGPFNSVQKDTQRFNTFGGSVGGPIWKHKVFFFFSYEGIHNDSTNFGNGWYETPQLDKMAPAGSIAQKYLSFPGEGASFSSIVNVPCASQGLVQGVNCNMIPGAGLDVGSPLKTPLGTPDPTYGGNVNTPGVGSGLDGIPDLAFVNTVNPSTISDAQFSGRLDFNVTEYDLVAFSIYKEPTTNTSFNGPNRAANI
ncbi:MAG: carboxypeptidase regulatory-like domain-containing protein [Terriglobia bacterium]